MWMSPRYKLTCSDLTPWNHRESTAAMIAFYGGEAASSKGWLNGQGSPRWPLAQPELQTSSPWPPALAGCHTAQNSGLGTQMTKSWLPILLRPEYSLHSIQVLLDQASEPEVISQEVLPTGRSQPHSQTFVFPKQPDALAAGLGANLLKVQLKWPSFPDPGHT